MSDFYDPAIHLAKHIVTVTECANGSLVEDYQTERIKAWTKHPEVEACFARAVAVVQRIRFPGYSMTVTRTWDAVFVYVTYQESDIFTGTTETQKGRRWVIENHWNDAQIAQTFLKAILTSLEHRAREHFTLDNRAIFNPHHTLAQLITASEGQERHHNNEIKFE